MASSSDRPVILRKRPDLVVTEETYDGRTFYMIKDPVGLTYFRFHEEEYQILELLNGHRSMLEIKKAFEKKFKPQRLKLAELQGFLGQLHESGLVLSESRGQGEKLLKRANDHTHRKIAGAMANLLYIKLPGFDPERILKWMHPYFRWIFTPAGVIGAFLLMMSAILLVATNFDEFRSKPEMQNFQAFFNVHNIVWLWVAMAVVKVIHEFGHGLTCTNFGGECHEMGVLLLVFSPGLYCNVSDAWMMPNKWHRIWISAAGIYVEVVLASIATWLWWFSSPGMLHNLSFAVMFICSVNTIVMNANPLMKFDGYYMLSDLLEIPNLQQKSFQLFQTFFADVCLGMETREPHFMPQQRRGRFITYAIAVYLYRWMVSFGVLWFLYTFLKPYKLQALGAVLAVASLYALLLHPLIQLVKFLRAPGRTVSVSKLRICLTLLVVAGLIAAVLCIPIPHRVTTVLTIEPHDFDSVFITVPGTLEAVYVEPGEFVHKGDLLAELENESLRLELEGLERQEHTLEAGVRTYLALDRPGERVQTEDALRETREQITQRREQISRLQIRAPRSGIIIPSPERPETVVEEDSELPKWERSPLLRENIGATLDAGTPLCLVADEREMEALLIIDQSDIESVRKNRKVRIVLDAFSETRINGEIIEIAQRQLQAAPVQIGSAGGGELPTKTDKEGRERPLSSSYQARVLLPNPNGLLEPGLRGRAKIFCGTRTCWQWFYRYLTRTFTFSL